MKSIGFGHKNHDDSYCSLSSIKLKLEHLTCIVTAILLYFGAVHVICEIYDHFQNEKFQSAPGSRVGTPAYLAPEVILTTTGKKYDGKVMCYAWIALVGRSAVKSSDD